MARRRLPARRGFGRRGSRSPTQWAFLSTDGNLLAGNKVILGSFFPTIGASHETVVRIVGGLRVEDATGNGGLFAVGAAVFASNAVAAGVASLPDPITDGGDDLWTFHQVVPYSPTKNTVWVYSFDSRAMRKVEDGQELVFIAANGVGGDACDYSIAARVLSKHSIRT